MADIARYFAAIISEMAGTVDPGQRRETEENRLYGREKGGAYLKSLPNFAGNKNILSVRIGAASNTTGQKELCVIKNAR